MIISANTKIAAILKYNPAALDAIISISPRFEKLRNPVLRKLMAGRTSVSMASRIGGCSPDDFFNKLQQLGFEVDKTAAGSVEEKSEVPEWMSSLQPDQIVHLDVRPIFSSGEDPLKTILAKIKSLQQGQALKITNTFEPTPLMSLLEKQGFTSYAHLIDDNLVETYFYKLSEKGKNQLQSVGDASKNWEEIIAAFKDKVQTIDVRALEMPLPMLTILDALDKLSEATALYVYHKRIPVFLLPEIVQRKFDYRIKEISDSEVHLLIFKAHAGYEQR